MTCTISYTHAVSQPTTHISNLFYIAADNTGIYDTLPPSKCALGGVSPAIAPSQWAPGAFVSNRSEPMGSRSSSSTFSEPMLQEFRRGGRLPSKWALGRSGPAPGSSVKNAGVR